MGNTAEEQSWGSKWWTDTQKSAAEKAAAEAKEKAKEAVKQYKTAQKMADTMTGKTESTSPFVIGALVVGGAALLWIIMKKR